ncbi:MAG: hypothetical protein QM673_14045 [Gordonia sp. (in: high G+C Gram-positive bacteria)]
MPAFARFVISVLAATIALVVGGCASDHPARHSGVALPADFPRDQVPLIDGTVLSARGDREAGWSLTVQAPASDTDVLDRAVHTLTAAGYRETQRNGAGGQVVVVLSRDKNGTTYWVQAGASTAAAAGASAVFYQVSIG